MTHGHEQHCGDCLREWGTGWRGAKGENWDNYNSIINKIYVKKSLLKIQLCKPTIQYIILKAKIKKIVMPWQIEEFIEKHRGKTEGQEVQYLP